MKKISIVIPVLASLPILTVGCQKPQQTPAQTINVLMKKYEIQPNVIRVKSGQPVELDVTTADVQHGLDIPDLGIKESVQPGRTTKITFTPQNKGEFKVACGVICGPHHEDMVGKLVVE
jgi:cytochrome c oxidase subunit II